MKWDFFYDEGNGKPYQSWGDWYRDIRHLVWPFILALGSGIAILLYLKFFST